MQNQQQQAAANMRLEKNVKAAIKATGLVIQDLVNVGDLELAEHWQMKILKGMYDTMKKEITPAPPPVAEKPRPVIARELHRATSNAGE